MNLTASFFIQNRKKLNELLTTNSCVVLWGNPIFNHNENTHFPFIQNKNFYYLTGIRVPNAVLVLVKRKNSVEECLFIPEPTLFRKQWDSNVMDASQATDISGIKEIYWTENLSKWLKNFELFSLNVLTGIYKNSEPGIQFHNQKAGWLKRLLKTNYVESVIPIMNKLRMVKEPVELELIQQAIEITGFGYKKLIQQLPNCKSEKQLHWFLIDEFNRNGANGMAFDPIIASGKNATVLHYVENSADLAPNDLLLLDIGAEYLGWNADMTRVIPINGIMTKRQSDVFDAVEKAYKHSLTQLKPGMSITDLNKITAKAIAHQLVVLGLISEKEANENDAKIPAYRRYYMHSASHFLGMEVHDVGGRNEPLTEGMVITLEPGIYINEEKIGIRLENDLLIGKNSVSELSGHIPLNWKDLLDWGNS